MRIHLSPFAVVMALLPFQAGCDLETFAASDRYREDFQYTHDLKPGGSVTLDNMNGSVEIIGWEKNSVQITGTKYAGSERDLEGLRIETVANGDAVAIRTIRPSDRRGNMGARYFVRVPRSVELSRIVSSNGSLRVEDIEGNARLETSNGSVRMRRVVGQVEAKTSNGSIEAGDVEAVAVFKTSNGAIRIDHMRGAVDAQTSNGSINVQFDRAKAGASLSFDSSNGGIDVSCVECEGNPIEADTSNASITLRLPSSARASVRAHTSNHSSVTTEFDVATAGGEIGKGRLEGNINGGGPSVRLTTSNGSIRILKL